MCVDDLRRPRNTAKFPSVPLCFTRRRALSALLMKCPWNSYTKAAVGKFALVVFALIIWGLMARCDESSGRIKHRCIVYTAVFIHIAGIFCICCCALCGLGILEERKQRKKDEQATLDRLEEEERRNKNARTPTAQLV